MSKFRRIVALLLLSLLVIGPSRPAYAYSILTHEQLIDLLWSSHIEPLLKQHHKHDTELCKFAETKKYAYGGALIPDGGYYPHGKRYTSDLTHYVRTGDFVTNLFRNATDACELAFAIGALTHYIGDMNGHALATNIAVAKEYRKLAAEIGRKSGSSLPATVITYEQGMVQHKRVEFGFDLDSINRQRFAPRDLYDETRLDVPLQQLTYAFYQTYGLSNDFTLLGNDLNVKKYRDNAGKFIPLGVYAVAEKENRRKFIETTNVDSVSLNALIANIAKEEHWDEHNREPTLTTKVLAFVLKIFPVVPSARDRYPNAETQQLYISSVVHTVDQLREILSQPADSSGHFIPDWPVQAGPHSSRLLNVNLDTGRLECPASYRLADQAYFDLLSRIAEEYTHNLKYHEPIWPIPGEIRKDILQYFSDPTRTYAFGGPGSKKARTLQENVDTMSKIPNVFGCPAGKFGKASRRYDVLSEDDIPALCDSTRQ